MARNRLPYSISLCRKCRKESRGGQRTRDEETEVENKKRPGIDFQAIFSQPESNWCFKPNIPIWADNGPRSLPSSLSSEQCPPHPILVRFSPKLGYDSSGITREILKNSTEPQKCPSQPSRPSDYPCYLQGFRLLSDLCIRSFNWMPFELVVAAS